MIEKCKHTDTTEESEDRNAMRQGFVGRSELEHAFNVMSRFPECNGDKRQTCPCLLRRTKRLACPLHTRSRSELETEHHTQQALEFVEHEEKPDAK